MKRTLHLIVSLVLVQGNLSAQETAAGGQAAPTTPAATTPAATTPAATTPAATTPASPVPSNQPSGLLTPPPDTAPVPAPPDGTGATNAAANPAPPAPPMPTTPATPAKLSPREVRALQQQEIIRRQELIYRADHSMSAGRKAEIASQYPEARKDYLFSAEAYGSISRSTDSYATAAEGLTRVDFQLYDDALKIGDTARAKHLMDEVIKYNPNNKLANEKLAAINHALDNPNDTTQLGNPAVTPGFVKRVNEVQQLFAEAEQFRRTGQWDEADARLKRILGIDPYNIAATKELERIDAEKMQYDDHARLETRDERLRQVEEKWYEPINNKDATAGAQEGQPIIVRNTNFGIDQKLKDIFLSLDFNNATIEEATNFLSIESKRLDPEHKGVNFVIQPEASTTAKPVSITLNNVPLGEALRYVCQLANVKFKVQDYAISIVPFSQNTDDLISRTFIVQPNFVAPPSAVGAVGTGTGALNGGGPTRPVPAPVGGGTTPVEGSGDTVRQALMAKGVKFPPGASAVYTPSTGQLTVVDTADQMELLEELVNAGQAPTLMVRIATKFVEINQNDLNDLTFNTAINFLNPISGVPINTSGSITSNLLTGSSFVTALPGAFGFSADSIDQLIAPTSITANTFFLRGLLSGDQYNLVITALAQKKSFDLLSEPAVLTKSGEQGVLEAVRVFPYPISFDPPELVTQVSNGSTTGTTIIASNPPTVIPTTPTDFKRRNVGVRLVIKPQITADNKTVDLSLFPEVTDFEGFINYGSPIFVANPDGSQSLLSNNQINQPVFNTRRINTKVLVHDGSTVVLGGLIRDDVQNINDRVPFLGDLPLIGRLFQSKAVENTKRNLIIFVSANIYRNDGELLNQPEVTNTADILTGHAGFAPVPTP
jgi:general secretion pathway protein D